MFCILGGAAGVLMNICIDWLPAGKLTSAVMFGSRPARQQCFISDTGQATGYAHQAGHGRFYPRKRAFRYTGIVLGVTMLFGLAYRYYGLSVESGVFIFYSCLFVILGIIDLEHKVILNKTTYPASAIALEVNLFLPHPGITSAFFGGVAGFIFLMLPAVLLRGGMGWGDVKMAALIGIVTGFPMVFVSLSVGVILGGLTAIALLLLRIKKRKEMIPFGPFLSISTIVTLLYGSNILEWYLRLPAG